MGNFQMPYEPDIGDRQVQSATRIVYNDAVGPGQFRLLELNGTDAHGLLQCSLKTHRLKDGDFPSYSAISYTWDPSERVWYGTYDPSADQPILLNGTLTAVSNKVANIMSLMYQQGRRSIWIDSICIDQRSIDDKSNQVSQMGAIYINAIEVISVLGSPSSKSDDALTADHWFSESYRDKHADQLAFGLYDVLAFNGYWRRAWVLQEITLARKSLLCCGSRLVDFETAKDFFATFQAQSSFSSLTNFRQTGEQLRYLKKVLVSQMDEGTSSEPFELGSIKSFRGQAFLDLLRGSRRFDRCQDPRDMIYSRLALATDAANLVDSPDYSLTPEQVYARFAVNCVTKTGSLEILTHATRPTSARKMSSWIPDWTRQDKFEGTGIWKPSSMTEVNHASMAAITWEKTDPPHVRWDEDVLELTVPARVLHAVPPKKQATASRAIWKAVTGHVKESWHEMLDTDDAEALITGDLVCVLPSCSQFVCLRPQGDHYTVVGRDPDWQKRIIKEILIEHVWSYEAEESGQKKRAKWRFRDPGAVSRMEVKRLKVR
ncbi:hypothetical protein DPSP01_009519 [Paraphaeosphaeria sporulosa]|uniref:Heterokaryon incompatibility domain-containing protein n=1 Tax=Paraphaeosphaeria sporulosa TaxID=1460663 RepID=A0A177C0Q9_9PLEO|nr:uncharacterized protein CC84DRAFT_1263231 [Paraphaeosphaeria sporulosa]OAG01223.1 hypothetical protein CC84DRAFT_1263231 [Paraphaeosphaeria sporulosa]